MVEFRLPDRLKDLIAEEMKLLDEFHAKEAEYHLVRNNLPAGVNPMKTPAFFSLLVAHRKWQFAYEKKKKLERAKA